MINIELTEEQALLISQTKKHHDKIATLMAEGVFEIKNGKAIINFDSEGTLRTVVIERVVYKK